MAKLVYLLLLAGAIVRPAMAQAIEGTVTDAFTGAGIPDAFVAIVDLSGKTVAGAHADAQGRFQIEGVKDGIYRTRALAPDYPVSLPDPRAFPVVGGKATLALRLSRRPKLSGRVVDPSGEAVANARVVLATRPYLGQVTAATDAKGLFETYVDTGVSYLLSVVPPAGRKPPAPDPETGAERAWARTYYPGVLASEAATPISVLPGLDIPNLEWKLRAAPTNSVRGILLKPDGTPAPDVDLDIGEDPEKPAVEATSNADGTFEFRIVDGRWRVAAELDGTFGERPRVSQWIEVAGHPIEGLTLQSSAPFTIHGQVQMETPEGAPPPRPPGMSLCVNNGACTPADPDAAGDFFVEHVYPGLYNVLPKNPPPGYYLDAVRLGESEWSDDPMEIASGAVPVTLVYKTGGGILRGTVEKCASGGVLLIPAGPLRWPGVPRPAACEETPVGPAHYEVRDIRPGEYYALALSGDRGPFWRMGVIPPGIAGGIDVLLSQAPRVTIRAGEVATADLRAVSLPH